MGDRAKGILCILASAFGFALMALFVRMCDDFGAPVSSFQKSFFRNAIALVIAAAVFLRSRKRERTITAASDGNRKQSTAIDSYRRLSPAIESNRRLSTATGGNRRKMGARAWLLLLGRSAAGCVGIFGNFYALSKIPIGEAMALNKTAPFFTVLFSWIFLKERATLRQFFWILAAFAGVLLVMRPGFRGADAFATLCALGGGLGAGIAYTCVRELGVLKVDGSFIVLFFSAFSCLASLPFMAAGADPMTWRQVAIMLGAGCGAALGQFGVTAAYRFAPPREIAVYDYSNVVFTALLGLAFFGQIPDALSAAGFALIVFAAVETKR